MPTTSNFGWTTPADTDLVKDGAAAIRTLGNGVDTSLVDLKGGTTGQILSKASNTDLDYTWITNDQGDITAVTAGTGITGGGTTGAVTITNDMATTITAAGDIVVGTGNATYDNLPIGTTGQLLTVDTTVSPYKVKWAAPAGGGKVLQVVSAVITTDTTIASTTLSDTGITLAITPTLASSKVLVMIMAYAQQDATSNTTEYTSQAVIDRAGTDVFDTVAEGFRVFGFPSSNPYFRIATPVIYLDSPATTSATTYKLQAKVGSTANGRSIRFQPSSTSSTITLMEIGA